MSADLASFMKLEAETALERAIQHLSLIAAEEGVGDPDRELAVKAWELVFEAKELLKKTKFPEPRSVKWMRRER